MKILLLENIDNEVSFSECSAEDIIQMVLNGLSKSEESRKAGFLNMILSSESFLEEIRKLGWRNINDMSDKMEAESLARQQLRDKQIKIREEKTKKPKK